jgi:pantothenate kinase
MEEAFDALAKRSIAAIENTSRSSRHLIAIAGAPGSGKSTLAKEVTKRINVVLGQDVAVNVPMDGYHLYRRQLDAMADPDEAYRRRGAPWTFDASAYVAFMSAAKQLQASGTLWAPSFDHGVGDPVEHAIKVTPNHRVLLSEGNYVLLGT